LRASGTPRSGKRRQGMPPSSPESKKGQANLMGKKGGSTPTIKAGKVARGGSRRIQAPISLQLSEDRSGRSTPFAKAGWRGGRWQDLAKLKRKGKETLQTVKSLL